MNDEPTRQERIQQLTDEYNSYLHDLTSEDLDLMDEMGTFTVREARELWISRNEKENELS